MMNLAVLYEDAGKYEAAQQLLDDDFEVARRN